MINRYGHRTQSWPNFIYYPNHEKQWQYSWCLISVLNQAPNHKHYWLRQRAWYTSNFIYTVCPNLTWKQVQFQGICSSGTWHRVIFQMNGYLIHITAKTSTLKHYYFTDCWEQTNEHMKKADYKMNNHKH